MVSPKSELSVAGQGRAAVPAGKGLEGRERTLVLEDEERGCCCHVACRSWRASLGLRLDQQQRGGWRLSWGIRIEDCRTELTQVLSSHCRLFFCLCWQSYIFVSFFYATWEVESLMKGMRCQANLCPENAYLPLSLLWSFSLFLFPSYSF